MNMTWWWWWYIYIYTYIYIYCYRSTDCFVVSQLISGARHVRYLKLGPKSGWLYVSRISYHTIISKLNGNCFAWVLNSWDIYVYIYNHSMSKPFYKRSFSRNHKNNNRNVYNHPSIPTPLCNQKFLKNSSLPVQQKSYSMMLLAIYIYTN